ncbi:MAG: hypothetical protein LBK93_01140 [Rickettsiales bacterium]|nr:hypothetical protein [Rickettsiales bacterium]
MYLVVSDYHLKDLSPSLEKLSQYGIRYNTINIDKFRKYNLKHSIYQKRFDDHCFRIFNRCVCLSDRKLYHCGLAANSKALRNKFGEEYLITKDDFLYIDGILKEDLLRFVLHPSDFCTYCSYSDMKEFDYGISELKKEEWIDD